MAPKPPRRRKGQAINGWIILDKPSGMTSTTAVAVIKRLVDAQKAGHGGTLDPMATGILPIALGEATKTVSYVMDGVKDYEFVVRWGEGRNTDDAEGTITETSPVPPSREPILATLPQFTGEILQTPPQFSALKIAGERAYDLARSGETVALAPRLVRIDTLTLVDQPDADHARFRAVTGKGTYVRAIARDLAIKLGTYGHITALRRCRVGPFVEAKAITLDKLEALGHSPDRHAHILPVATALDDIPALALTEAEAVRLRGGQPVSLFRRIDLMRIGDLDPGAIVRAMDGDRLIAIALFDAGEIRPVRVINS